MGRSGGEFLVLLVLGSVTVVVGFFVAYLPLGNPLGLVALLLVLGLFGLAAGYLSRTRAGLIGGLVGVTAGAALVYFPNSLGILEGAGVFAVAYSTAFVVGRYVAARRPITPTADVE